MNPLVSIITPCFNQANFLGDLIASLMSQSYSDWEWIIVNDGSTDDTEEVAREWSLRDRRIKYVKKVNGGLSSARNAGLDVANGEYIQFLDADDVILPKKLSRQISQLNVAEGLALSYCDYRRGKVDDVYSEPSLNFTDLPTITGTEPFYEQLIRYWETQISIPAHCFLFDAAIFKKHGIRFDENLLNHEDWDCWTRIASLPVESHYLQECLAIYRYNPDSMCHDRVAMGLGFLAAIDKQIELNKAHKKTVKMLNEKKKETIACYVNWTQGEILNNLDVENRNTIQNPTNCFLTLKRLISKVSGGENKN